MSPLIAAAPGLLRGPGVLVLVLITLALLASRRWLSRVGRKDVHRRGVQIEPLGARIRRRSRSARADGAALSLAGLPVAPLDEVKHFKILGATGTGKTTAIGELLRGALARGDRAVIADPDGGYAKRFLRARRGDLILNPFDPAAVRWEWAGEIENKYDLDLLVGALIPSSPDAAGEEWRGYARTFCAAVARRCTEAGAAGPVELWRLLTTATSEELRPLVAGTAAQPFLDPENARMFGSIRSVCASALAAFEHIGSQRARPFSIRSWVRNRGAPGVLFMPYKASQIPALRPVIAAWLRLAIVEALSGPEGADQRLWFVVDELDALGPIEGLKDALARLRKFGGRCVLGFQSIAQVSSSYGAGPAQTIVENCSNTLILRCSGSENGGTSLFASKLIGEREVQRRQTGRSRDQGTSLGGRGTRRSTSVNEQTVVEAAVLPSEIERLPDLHGYLKLASLPVWRAIALERARSAAVHANALVEEFE